MRAKTVNDLMREKTTEKQRLEIRVPYEIWNALADLAKIRLVPKNTLVSLALISWLGAEYNGLSDNGSPYNKSQETGNTIKKWYTFFRDLELRKHE